MDIDTSCQAKWIWKILKNIIIYWVLIGAITMSINSLMSLWIKEQTLTFSAWWSNIFTSEVIKLTFTSSITIVLILLIIGLKEKFSPSNNNKNKIDTNSQNNVQSICGSEKYTDAPD